MPKMDAAIMGCFHSIRERMKNRCKYAYKCPYFAPYSYTCEHQGGPYCGKYREYEKSET